MVDLKKIRLAIREKYENEVNYAEHIGLTKSKLSLILNGKRKMSLEFADELIKNLEIKPEDIQSIFFTN